MPLLLGSVAINYPGRFSSRERARGSRSRRIIALQSRPARLLTNISASSRGIASKALPWQPWDVTLLALVLPLGISFFTFQQIAYQVDR